MISKEIEEVVDHFINHRDVESAIKIAEQLIQGNVIIGTRNNITKNALSVILADYKNLEAEKKEVIEILDRYAKKEVNEDNVVNFYTEIKKVVK